MQRIRIRSLGSLPHSAWSQSWMCLSPTPAIVGQFEGAKGAKFHGNPLFVCFRTKSDVHPVRAKSLSENLFTIFRYLSKKFWLFCPMVKQKINEQCCVTVLDIPSSMLSTKSYILLLNYSYFEHLFPLFCGSLRQRVAT